MTRRHVGIVALVVVAVLAVGAIYLMWQGARFARERAELEWASLSSSAAIAQTRKVPEEWSAGIFVSEAGFAKLLAALHGAKISYDPAFSSDDTIVTLKSVSMSFEPGFAVGNISLSAHSERQKLSVDFKGQASISFREIAVLNGRAEAVFAIHLLDLEPQIGWYSIGIGFRGYAKELLTSGTMVYLAEQLVVRVPLTNEVAFDLAQAKDLHLPTVEPKKDNFVDVNLSVPTKVIRKKFLFMNPVFLKGGVWLLAQPDDGETPITLPAKESKPGADLSTRIEILRQQVAKIPTPTEDMSIWLRGETLQDLVKGIRSLPKENRTVKARTIRFNGVLTTKEGGSGFLWARAYAELTGDNPAQGNAEISEVEAQWIANKGLKVSGRVDGNAVAFIRVRVVPVSNSGKGLGTVVDDTVAMIGGGGLNLDGVLSPRVVTVDNHKALIVAPEFDCKPYRFDVAALGGLGSLGIFSVAGVSATISGKFGGAALSQQLIISDLPYLFKGQNDDGTSLKIVADGKHLQFKPRWNASTIAVVPAVSLASSEGMSVGSTLEVGYLANVPSTNEREEQEKKLREKLSTVQTDGTQCGEPQIDIKIGDISVTNPILTIVPKTMGLPPGTTEIIDRLQIRPPTVGEVLRNSPIRHFLPFRW
ncbi:hypothetical protein [Rhizobium sp. WYCCWR 11146]|uniref:hypothetical protein n=1 Tax=Rhizobium sp. WYCCWR 11146 TaxID=2749833 RepID=UPI0015E6A0A6|nr:hypothetical protein [Rhizobium sp. WYCCWR 11146]MBA1343909.1 hypothetical protein [Rhizobium sp. WYCCWR 11146]